MLFVIAEVADGIIEGSCHECYCKMDDSDSSKRAKTSTAEKQSFIFKNPLGKHSLITENHFHEMKPSELRGNPNQTSHIDMKSDNDNGLQYRSLGLGDVAKTLYLCVFNLFDNIQHEKRIQRLSRPFLKKQS